jgi:serine/threonine protein kinase
MAVLIHHGRVPRIPLPSGYYYEKELGRGGFGEVWLVRDKNGRPFAFKILRSETVAADVRERFIKEATRAERLRYEQGIREVVEVVEFFPNHSAYLMEYLPKGSADHFRETGDASFLKRLAAAVARLHACNVAHRDLKPENVRAREDGTPVLLDFGVASWGDTNSATFLPAIGTIYYAPPESPLYQKGSPHYPGGNNPASLAAFAQLDRLEPRGSGKEAGVERWRNCKRLHDVYSLGLTIGVIMTGRLPFKDKEELNGYLVEGRSDKMGPWLQDIPDQAMRQFVKESMAFMPLERKMVADLVELYLPEFLSKEAIEPISETEADYLCLDCGEKTAPPANFCQRCAAPRRFIGLHMTPERQARISPGQPWLRLLPKGRALDLGLESAVILVSLMHGDREAVLGRHPKAQIAFPEDADPFISRVHGRLIVKQGKVAFADGAWYEKNSDTPAPREGQGRAFHNPANRSIYNSLPVSAEPVEISPGGYLSVGSTTFTVLGLFSRNEFEEEEIRP